MFHEILIKKICGFIFYLPIPICIYFTDNPIDAFRVSHRVFHMWFALTMIFPKLFSGKLFLNRISGSF